MFYKASDRIADKFVEVHAIQAADRNIYRFGIQQGLTILLNLVTTLTIGLALGMVLEAFVFLVTYIPLRSFAGGVHAKTANRCYVYSIFMIIAVLLIIKYFPLGYLVCSCLAMVGGILIFFLAPVQDHNKPLDEKERAVYRKRTRCILCIECLLLLLFWGIHWYVGVSCIALTLAILSIMLLLGILKNRYIQSLE